MEKVCWHWKHGLAVPCRIFLHKCSHISQVNLSSQKYFRTKLVLFNFGILVLIRGGYKGVRRPVQTHTLSEKYLQLCSFQHNGGIF